MLTVFLFPPRTRSEKTHKYETKLFINALKSNVDILSVAHDSELGWFSSSFDDDDDRLIVEDDDEDDDG